MIQNNLLVNFLILLGIVTLPFYYELLSHIPHICLMEYFLNLPCPGCGVLTGILALMSLDFSGSLSSNPLALVIVLYFILDTIMEISFRLKFIQLSNKFRFKIVSNNIILYFALGNWILTLTREVTI